MGLSIHYHGAIANASRLPEMVEELYEISRAHGWSYTIFDSEFERRLDQPTEHDGSLYGIEVQPPNCEPVAFAFLSNGRMSSAINLTTFGRASSKPETDYLYWVSVKTQFAGVETHKQVITLFRHVSQKYLQGFEMQDEGQFWETGDEDLLKSNFHRYTILLETVKEKIQYEVKKPGESYEQYFNRILESYHKKTRGTGGRNEDT